MVCPNCGCVYENGCCFCGKCGAVLTAQIPAKRGSHWVPILIMVILSALGIGLFFATAEAEITPQWFRVSDNTVSFDESRYTGPAELEIPDSIGGEEILYLEQACFADCDSLTTVILPAGLQAVCWCAFEDCDNLRGIFIPEGVSVIDDYAFGKCRSLEAVCIPASVTYISPGAFYDCPALKHVFYGGTYDQWLVISDGYAAPDANIYCTDGNYCQGIPIP
ncbi:MAG: leucine-rich repeat protein [Oscillospiraceae bacterium]|nr:leucine-rich repeat protein [Oscillospiraceae bacterium]